jgi:Caspase domain
MSDILSKLNQVTRANIARTILFSILSLLAMRAPTYAACEAYWLIRMACAPNCSPEQYRAGMARLKACRAGIARTAVSNGKQAQSRVDSSESVKRVSKGQISEPSQQSSQNTARPERINSSAAGKANEMSSIPDEKTAAPSGGADRRVALVIGNSHYRKVPVLANPVRDATLMADTFKSVGFQDVTVVTDLDKNDMVGALRDFAAKAEVADWAVIYYAGHGMEVAGVNYLVPVDATIAVDRDVGFEAVPLDQVLNAAERAKKLHLVILDACRDNPFKNQMKRTLVIASRSVSGGLAPIEPDAGTLVVYAAKDGETASDGDSDHSPFAAAFVRDVRTPGLEVRRLFDFVRDDVIELTHHQQKPFSYGSISGRQDFYFVSARNQTDK